MFNYCLSIIFIYLYRIKKTKPMRQLNILKAILDFFWFFSILGAIVHLFNRIGQLVIASSLTSNISLFIYKFVEKDQAGLSIDLGSYDSFLISISLGLFFIVIGAVFKIAAKMKEENELTI